MNHLHTLASLHEILSLVTDDTPEKRVKGANLLWRYGGRDVFLPLTRLAFDSDLYVRQEAILGIGVSKDSRGYFFLAQYFNHADQFDSRQALEIKRRILNAFQANRDPRAVQLVQQATRNKKLHRMAQHTLTCIQRKKYAPFVYTFHLAEEDRKQAEQYSGKPLTCRSDLEMLIPILEEEQRQEQHFEKPQTYVVDLQCRFLVGGTLHEHVQVASGRDILAAGEAYFDRDERGWYIRELNNRSTGYYPHEGCITQVQEALQSTGIRFPKEFEKIYPFYGWFDEDLLTVQWATISQHIGVKYLPHSAR